VSSHWYDLIALLHLHILSQRLRHVNSDKAVGFYTTITKEPVFHAP